MTLKMFSLISPQKICKVRYLDQTHHQILVFFAVANEEVSSCF